MFQGVQESMDMAREEDRKVTESYGYYIARSRISD